MFRVRSERKDMSIKTWALNCQPQSLFRGHYVKSNSTSIFIRIRS